jgi:hypothetical protein
LKETTIRCPPQPVLSVRTVADLAATQIPLAYDTIILLGYTNVFDAPPVVYNRWLNSGSPPHPGKLTDGFGKWWVLAPEVDYFDVRWFGAQLDGISDDRAALEAAILSASPASVPGGGVSSIRKVFIPSGILLVKRQVDPTKSNSVFVRGVSIEGDNWNTSLITCQLNEPESLFVFDGGEPFAEGTPNGGMRRIGIFNGVGKTGGYAIRVEGGNQKQAYESVFEDLKIGGVGPPQPPPPNPLLPPPPPPPPPGRWQYPFYMNGSYSPSAPQGLRKVSLRNIFLGNPTIHGLGAGSVGDLIVESTSVYGGTVASNNFYVFGTAAAPNVTANLSNGVQFIGCDVDAALFVYNCEGFNFSGIANNIYFYGGAKGCAFNGVRPASAITVLGQGGNVINAATW